MGYAAVAGGILILLIVLLDTFETIILPRSVNRPLRLTSLLTALAWRIWRSLALAIRGPRTKEIILSAFGPMALVLLIVFWAFLLVLGFAAILWGLQAELTDSGRGFAEYLYLSGTTLFTLGYGDITPVTPLGRLVCVIESGVGFGFLALVIGYLPVQYQAFSKREATILLLDARAGSPPVACNLLARQSHDLHSLRDLLAEFERWSAKLLESYLSFPILAFYRSQHERLTWLGGLTAILDTCSLIKLEFKQVEPWQRALHRQAELTYAMARHLIVDLAFILNAKPVLPSEDRLPHEAFEELHAQLQTWGIVLHDSSDSEVRLSKLRREYEPYLEGLSKHLLLTLPPMWQKAQERDSWQTSAWDGDGHF